MEALRKDIIDAVQKANTVSAKSIDVKLDDQRKALTDSQARTEQLSAKFTQFNQALTGFRDSLTSMGERLGQEEQANKALAAKIEADTKASTLHINETTKTMSGHLSEVNKSVSGVAQKLAARIDEQVGEVNKNMTTIAQRLDARITEQERRVDGLARNVDHVTQEAHTKGTSSKGGQRPSPTTTKSTPRASTTAPAEAAPPSEPVAAGRQESAPVARHETDAATPVAERSVAAAAPAEELPEPVQVASIRPAERSDRAEYERILAYFKEGNLDGSRDGFSAFLTEYPNSDLAPNARYWLGESHYGKKDYKQAIDSYDRVELDYPQSEKVPAAILKKGFAYLALKDKKRASSAFKQVVTLYPKSPEAGKAYDKLNQMKEQR
jgi:tol-pal system protein YbgF